MTANWLLYTLPALISVLGICVVLYMSHRGEQSRRRDDLKRVSQREITNIRFRAYERLALLLERTEPEHIVAHTAVAGLTVDQLRKLVVDTIRAEFEHNMSQQIYVSDELWTEIMQARDEMLAFVNVISVQLPAGSTAIQYAEALITAYNSNGDTPHGIALEHLKHEVKALF